MRRIALAALIAFGHLAPARGTPADDYVALGGSITFGENDLAYGDRGYVGGYADYLGATTGARATVVNIAIDGETASSFATGSGRVPPVVGRTDAVPPAEKPNDQATPNLTREERFLATVAAGQAVTTVSVTPGFNDPSTLVGQPPEAVSAGLTAYQDEYAAILALVRQRLPDAHLLLLGHDNLFPADPTNPAPPTFNTNRLQLNAIIRSLESEHVDTATPFVGHEAEYTYLARMPHRATSPPFGPYVGVEPIDNVHPDDEGSPVITLAAEADVPEPSTAALAGLGLVSIVLMKWRKRFGTERKR